MGVWDTYGAYIGAKGGSKRDAAKKREERFIVNHLIDNMSYHTAIVDGVERQVGIINSDNLDEKSIISMPGEDLRHGALVEWMDNRWLITDRDANTTLYTKCKMKQCNHLLKWVNAENRIIEQWAIVSDGTKFAKSFAVWQHAENNYSLNCWNTVKILLLQRKDEICLCANAAKAERKQNMAHGQILQAA